MIVSKIKNEQNNSFEPDLSAIDFSKWEVKGHKLNPDGETYTLILNWVSPVPYTISQLQGKLQLSLMGKLEEIEKMVILAGIPTIIYWHTARIWHRDSPILNKLAPTVGMSQEDLDNFFIEASKLR